MTQRYRYGWFLAGAFLASTVDPSFVTQLGSVFGTGGLILGGLYALWKLAIGLAAAAVRPWSWYVLLAGQPLVLAWAGVYTSAFGSERMEVVMVFGVAAAIAVIDSVYFYKRRAMFGARWRWAWLERWFPRLIGPDPVAPAAGRGFAGLSPLRRRAFIAVTALMTVAVLFGK